MTAAASRARRATGMALPLNAVSADILQAELEQMATAILRARTASDDHGDSSSHSAPPGPVEEARVRFLRRLARQLRGLAPPDGEDDPAEDG